MDVNQVNKLKACRTIAEADPIMETLKLRPSQKKLVETAIQLQHSTDPRQRAHGEDFWFTAIKEAEEDEKDKDKIKEDDGGAHRKQGGEEDVKKLVEADEITGELDSHSSSDIDMPYPQEGADAPQSDIESSKTASGENQMREMPMPGMPQPGMPQQQAGGQPPMPGMMPPQQQAMPPVDPALMGGMKPQLPQGLNPAMMKQMQYTVQEAMKTYVRPVVREVKKLREAYIAIDKKMQETEAIRGNMTLDIESIKKNSPVHVRETIGDMEIPVPEHKHTRFDLESARAEIDQMDKIISGKKNSIYG